MRKELAKAVKRKMKRLVYVLAILVMPGLCFALDHVVISQVLYDPAGTETGGEAVELYNPAGSAVDIGGYVIKTESSATDAVVPEGMLLGAGKYYLIADAGWSTLRDNASWPSADHEEAITMSNTDAGVALALPDGTIIDAVGWGNAAGIGAGLYEGTPSAGVAEGSSLKRSAVSADTDDNILDFAEAVPDFHNSNSSSGGSGPNTTSQTGGESINISVEVTNTAPSVDYVAFSTDEDESTPGVQIIPVPEGMKDVAIIAEVTDADGTGSIVSVAATVSGPGGVKNVLLSLAENTSSTTAMYNGTVQMMFHDDAGVYNVTVSANDSSAGGSGESWFDYLSMAAISIDASSLQFTGAKLGGTVEINGDFALSTTDTPTVRNAGNTQIDIGLYGTDLADGINSIGIDNIKYSFDNDFGSTLAGTLGSSMQIQNLGLASGADSVISLGFQLYVPPETLNGNYTGQVAVVAVSS